jgi:hypothetical protein
MGNLELGDEVKDRISGFSGVITAKIVYLYGSDRFQVTSKSLDPKGSINELWFDGDQLLILSKGK